MYFKPPQNNMTSPFYHPLNRQPVQEDVTVEMEFKEELEEGTPAYRKMMKRYKGSDNEKVFKMLRAKGYKVGEQDDTLVQNLLKRHRGNVKKVVDQIVKDYPGKFDVERMMMDHVEIDEEKKLDSRGLGVTRQSGLGKPIKDKKGKPNPKITIPIEKMDEGAPEAPHDSAFVHDETEAREKKVKKTVMRAKPSRGGSY